MTGQAEAAERLTEHCLAALNEADPAGLVAIIAEAENPPNPEFGVDPMQEYRVEAEAIVRGIRHEERDRRLLGQPTVAAIVKSVVASYFEVRLSRKEVRRISESICARRLVDLLCAAVAEEAADPLADGRAVLRPLEIPEAGDDCELVPARATAAGLSAIVEYEALVNAFVADHHTIEFFSTDPNEILDEVRALVRALVAGTYHEQVRDKRHTTTTKAFWPGGGSTTIDATQDGGGPLTEWRKRAYDPY